MARPRLILSCEHARSALPPGVDLGLDAAAMRSHIAWDEAALPAARALAQALGAPLFEGRVSRLWVDLNRRAENPEVIPSVAFGVPVPGNQGLSAEQRRARIEGWHRPYVQAVEAAVRDLLAGEGAAAEGGRADAPCLHLSIHSFTPVLHGRVREVEVGLLFDPAREGEAALARRLAAPLAEAGLRVRDNEPYSGLDDGLIPWLRERLPAPAYIGLEIELNEGLDPARRQLAVQALLRGLQAASTT